MSDFGRPRGCINQCGSVIYFDANSKAGHPTVDKWVPLEYKQGIKTDMIHICHKKGQNGLPTVVTTTPSANQNKLDLNGLAMIKVIAAALTEYIEIKEQNRDH